MKRFSPEVLALSVILGIALLAALAVEFITHVSGSVEVVQKKVTTPRPVATATPIPEVLPGPLDGLQTTRTIALQRPAAVVIDNFYPDARPASGVASASLVFEALAEGGITRLLAIYLEHSPREVGPIRSARPYFVTWAAGFHALFVHAGGAPAALRLLYRTPQLANVEALEFQSGFRRTTDRPAPHNLYTSISGVRQIARRRHWDIRVNYPWLRHRRTTSSRHLGKRQSISISFSTPGIGSDRFYAVTYRYDSIRNRYLRDTGGKACVDRLDGQRVAPTNVAVLFTTVAAIPNDPAQRVSIDATGSGRALYFREGQAFPGRWEKASTLSGLRFLGRDGHAFPFDPGQTWVEVVSPGGLRYSSRA